SQTRFPGIPLAGRAQMGQAPGVAACGGTIGAAGGDTGTPTGSACGFTGLTEEAGGAGDASRATGALAGLPTGIPPPARGGPRAIASTTFPGSGLTGSADNFST